MTNSDHERTLPGPGQTLFVQGSPKTFSFYHPTKIKKNIIPVEPKVGLNSNQALNSSLSIGQTTIKWSIRTIKGPWLLFENLFCVCILFWKNGCSVQKAWITFIHRIIYSSPVELFWFHRSQESTCACALHFIWVKEWKNANFNDHELMFQLIVYHEPIRK